jgi:hypothetical protein
MAANPLDASAFGTRQGDLPGDGEVQAQTLSNILKLGFVEEVEDRGPGSPASGEPTW